MTSIIKNFFRGGKKSSNKKIEEEDVADLARELSNRRSFRAGTSSTKSSRRMTARFAEDGMLSATAAYHTNNAPKLKKGPQSCPGGYRDETESNNSFDSDKYSNKSSRRRDNVLNHSMRHNNYTIDEERSSKSSRKQQQPPPPRYNHLDFRRRGETSEYGSGDPSPIGNFSSRHSHYDTRLDESENDDFDEKEQIVMMERTNRHYMQKWKESEQKRREEKKKYKEIERERSDMQTAMFNYMRQADQLKKERDKYKAKLRNMENQLNEIRQQSYAQMSFNTPFNFCQQTSQQHRSSFLTNPTSNTPTTMASTGAGESLVQPSDVSLMHFGTNTLLTDFQNVMNNSPGFRVPPNHFNDEDTDEVKNFRNEELSIETMRKSSTKDTDTISCSSSADSNVTLIDDTKENNVPLRKINGSKANRSFSIMSI